MANTFLAISKRSVLRRVTGLSCAIAALQPVLLAQSAQVQSSAGQGTESKQTPAKTDPPPTKSGQRNLLPPVVRSPRTRKPGTALELNNFLIDVDRYYPKMRSIRLEQGIADGKAQEKRGAFDPIFRIGGDALLYNSSTTPGRAREFQGVEGSIEVMDRTGAKFEIGARLNQGFVKSPASSTGTAGEFFIVAKLPLLRDFVVNPKTIAERQAVFGQPLAEQNIRGFRFELFEKVGDIYWKWVGSHEKLLVAKELLSIAEDRYRFIEERNRQGLVPDFDVVESRLEVALRRGTLESAERGLQESELKLSVYLWDQAGKQLPIPSREQVPFLGEVFQDISDEELSAAIQNAYQRRPEMIGLGLSREILKLDVLAARNERRPSLDLTLAPTVDGGNNAIGLGYKAGIFYSLPLVQNTADGQILVANAKLQKLELTEELLRAEVEADVRDAVSAVRQAYRRIYAAREAVQSALELEEGERTRFTEGITTLLIVNLRERQRFEAERIYIDARADYEAAYNAFLARTAQLVPAGLGLIGDRVQMTPPPKLFNFSPRN